MASISYKQFFKPIKNDDFTLSDFTLDTIGNKTWQTNIAKSYARNDKSIWNVLSYISNLDCGGKFLDTIYDNIQHYVDNVSNIDLCKVKALQSLIKYFGINYAIFNYFDEIPIELYNLINILSINRYYLFDKDTGIMKQSLKNAVYEIIKNEDTNVNDQSVNNIRTNKISLGSDYQRYVQNNYTSLYSNTFENYGSGSDPKLKAIIEQNNLQISSIMPAELLSDEISDTQIVRYYKNKLFYSEKYTSAEVSAYSYILNNNPVNEISNSWGTFELISANNATDYDVNLNELYRQQNGNSLLLKIHINPCSKFILQKYGFTSDLDKYMYILSNSNDVYSMLQIGQHVQAYKAITKVYSGLSGKYIYPEYHYDMLHTSADDADATLSTYLISVDFDALFSSKHGYDITSESTAAKPGTLDVELEQNLSNVYFLNANATSENITFYDNTNIDYNKYKSMMQDLYKQLLSDMLTMSYISGDYIYKTIDTNSYTAVEENNAIKNYYNVPISFDEQTAVDNIEQNLSSYDDFSKTEQKVIDNEIARRVKANDINILESRYSFYREAKVKEYIKYVESIYNTFYNKNYNVYDVNKNYFNIENSNYISIIGTDDAGNKSIDFDKIDDVAEILTDITLTICRTREKVKSLVEKNSIRGTYLLIVIYLIEYFNGVIKSNYSEISSDISLQNIKLIEYIDNTDYFNIRNSGTNYTANENIVLNNKFWESTPIGDINAQTISSFYIKLMEVPEISDSAEQFDVKDFLTDVFKAGSFSYYDYKDNPAYESYVQEGQSTISTFNIQSTDRPNTNHDELVSVFNQYKYDSTDIDKSIYNIKNAIHASYQLHPYIYDFVEYLNIKYPIENLFHKYIPTNYDEVLSTKVDDYIGKFGQINNIWNHDVFDFSGYASRFEIDSNKSDYLKTSPYVDRDGAFIEEALSAYLDDYLTFANEVVEMDDDGKYKNKYYNHLKLSMSERQAIQKKLIRWHEFIEAIAKSTYHEYDIYSYANDIYGNNLILYKTYNQVNPTIEEKKNTLGTLWVRYKNHPIAFPAFDIGFDDSRLINHIYIDNSDQLISENAQYYNLDSHKLLKLFNDKAKFVDGFYDFELDNSLQQLFLMYPSNEYTDIKTYANSNIAIGKLTKTLNISTNSYNYSIEQNDNFIENVDNRNIRKSIYQKTWSDFIGFYKQNNRVMLIFVDKYLDEYGNETLYQTTNYERANNTQTYVMSLDNVILDFKTLTYEYYKYDIDDLAYNLNDSTVLLTNSNNIVTLAYVGKNEDYDGQQYITNYIEDHTQKLSTYADISSSYTFKSKMTTDTCVISAYEGMYVIYDRQYLSNNSTYNLSNMTSSNSYVMLETDIAGNVRIVPELSNLDYSTYNGEEMHGIGQYPNDVAADSNEYSNDNTFDAFKQYIVVIDLVYKNDQFTIDRDIQYYNLNSDITFLPNYPKEYGKMRMWYHQTLSAYENYKIQMMGKSSPCYEDVLKNKKTAVEEFIEREESPSESNGIRWESYPMLSTFTPSTTFSYPLSDVIPDNDKKDVSAVAIIEMPTSGKDYTDLSLPLNLDSTKTNHLIYLSANNTLSIKLDDTILDPTFNVAFFKKYQVPMNLTTNAFHVLSNIVTDDSDRTYGYQTANRIVITRENFVLSCHTSITESEIASKAFIYNVYKGYGEPDSAGWYHNKIILYSGILNDANNYTDYYGTQLFADNVDAETTKIANQAKAKSSNIIYIDGVERLSVETARTNVGTDQIDVDLSLHLIAEYPGYSFRRSLLSVEFLPVNYANYSEYEQYQFVQTKTVEGGLDTGAIELNASHSPYDYEALYEKDAEAQNPALAIKYQNEYDISQISNDFPTLLASLHIDVSEDILNSYSKNTVTDIRMADQFVVEIDDMPNEEYVFDYYTCDVDEYNRPVIEDKETSNPRCRTTPSTITFTPYLERLSGFYAFNDNIRDNGIKLFFNYNNNTANSFINPFYKYSYAIIPTGETSCIGLFNQVNTVYDYNPEVTKKSDDTYDTRISSYSVWYNIIFLAGYQIKNVSDHLPKYEISRIGLSDFLEQSGLQKELDDLNISSTFDEQNVMRHVMSARIEVNEQDYIYPVNLDDNKIITYDHQVKTFYFKNPNRINYLQSINDGHLKYTNDDLLNKRYDASIYESGMLQLGVTDNAIDYTTTELVTISSNNPASINSKFAFDAIGYKSYYTGLYITSQFYYAKFQDVSTFVSCSVPTYIRPTLKYTYFKYQLSAVDRLLAEETKIDESFGRQEDPSYILTEDGENYLALEKDKITTTNNGILYMNDDATSDIELYNYKYDYDKNCNIELNIRECYNLANNYNTDSLIFKTSFEIKDAANCLSVIGATNGTEIMHATLSCTEVNVGDNVISNYNLVCIHVTNVPKTEQSDNLTVLLSSSVDGNHLSSYFNLTINDQELLPTNVYYGYGKFNFLDSQSTVEQVYRSDYEYTSKLNYTQLLNNRYHTNKIVPLTMVSADMIDSETFKMQYAQHFDDFYDEEHLIPFDTVIGIQKLTDYSFRISSLNVIGTELPIIRLESYNYGFVDETSGLLEIDVSNTHSKINVHATQYNGAKPTTYVNPTNLNVEAYDIVKLSTDVGYINNVAAYDVYGNKIDIATSEILTETFTDYQLHNLKFASYHNNVAYIKYQFVNSNFKISSDVNIYITDFTKLKLYHITSLGYEMMGETEKLSVSYPSSIDSFKTNISTKIVKIEAKENKGTAIKDYTYLSDFFNFSYTNQTSTTFDLTLKRVYRSATNTDPISIFLKNDSTGYDTCFKFFIERDQSSFGDDSISIINTDPDDLSMYLEKEMMTSELSTNAAFSEYEVPAAYTSKISVMV